MRLMHDAIFKTLLLQRWTPAISSGLGNFIVKSISVILKYDQYSVVLEMNFPKLCFKPELIAGVHLWSERSGAVQAPFFKARSRAL